MNNAQPAAASGLDIGGLVEKKLIDRLGILTATIAKLEAIVETQSAQLKAASAKLQELNAHSVEALPVEEAGHEDDNADE